MKFDIRAAKSLLHKGQQRIMAASISLNPMNSRESGLDTEKFSDVEVGNNVVCGSKRTLLAVFTNETSVMSLLNATCNYWPSEVVPYYQFHRGLYLFGKAVIIAATLSTLFVAITSVVFYEYLFTFLLCVTKLLGFASVLPAQYYNQQRLSEVVKMGEEVQLGEAVRVSWLFGIISAVTVIVAFSLLAAIHDNNAVFILGIFVFGAEMLISMYLTFNLLFLMLDVEVSKQLLDHMSVLADTKSLMLSHFNTARNEIHRRVHLSKWATDIIVAPCIACMFTMVIIILYLDQGVANDIPLELPAAYLISLLKELLFVAVAFYYVAQVNERADALTVKLSENEWYPGADTLHKADAHRISICTTSIVKPISVTLLFTRLNWRNVLLSAAGFSLSMVVAVMKSLITGF